MPRRKKPEKSETPTVERVLSDSHKLSLSDLKLVRDALDVLIEQLEDKQLSPDERKEAKINHHGVGSRGSAGYIESKIIRGNGPYLYLRMRRNGIHHSFYLGKADDSNPH